MSNLKNTAKLIQEYFKINKELGLLLNGPKSLINSYNQETHRLHGKVNTLGTNTFRCTHNSPNITQVPRSKEFRELLCTPKNKCLIDVDANALIN